jgi:hypothetical protein
MLHEGSHIGRLSAKKESALVRLSRRRFRYETSRYSPGLVFVSRARFVLLFIAAVVRLCIDLLGQLG